MATTTPTAQYQHFVPQFILRNFSHPYKPDDGDDKKQRKGKAKRSYEKGMYPNDPVVRHLDLGADPPSIREKPVNRILGLPDMYNDSTKPTKQQREVEQLLSKLESQASQVFRKITKAYERKEPSMCIARTELIVMRKFLFLLKYRNERFYKRFKHDAPEGYHENDRDLVREYMAESGLARPLDVWLQAIKAIINLDMDLESQWEKKLLKEMYSQDARWFISDFKMYYMAICTPAEPDDEFILTNNSYSISEGPFNHVRDAKSNQVALISWTALHMFAPVSPKLMIVLRAQFLPDALECASEAVRKQMDMLRSSMQASILSGLVIEKARNSYTRIVNGRVEWIDGGAQVWKPKSSDTFEFRFFPTDRKHVNIINSVFLDNCGPYTNVIIFESMEPFQRTLEWFLTAPCDVAGKIIAGTDSDAREAAIKKMEVVARSLGFGGDVVMKRMDEPVMQDFEPHRQMYTKWLRQLAAMPKGDEDTLQMFQEMWAHGGYPEIPSDTERFQLYSSLDGTQQTFWHDMDQARRMWHLRVKIDSWSSGKVPESIRQRNRNLLLDGYLRLPPRRVWFYVQAMRYIILSQTVGLKPEDAGEVVVNGPETVIMRAKHIVSPDRLSAVIFRTGMNDINIRKKPDVDLWEDWTYDTSDRNLDWALTIIMDRREDSIKYCGMNVLGRRDTNSKVSVTDAAKFYHKLGIPEIEEASRRMESIIKNASLPDRFTGISELTWFHPTVREVSTELTVRNFVRENFAQLLKGKLEEALLNDLTKVFFEISYPTPALHE